MLSAKKYVNNSNLQRCLSTHFLKRSAGLITVTPNDVVMDIGCGTGDITAEVLPKQFQKLYAIDHSSTMIDYAKSHNSSDERIEYLIGDIGTNNAMKHMKGKVNHIYSFYCFHWIKDQDRLYNNIYDLLVPGGDLLCKFVVTAGLHYVWEIFKLSEKWGKFLRNAEIPFYRQESTEIINALMRNLENAGFSYILSVKDEPFTYATSEDFRAAMKAISPWLDSIPLNLQSEIMDEFMIESCKYNESVIKLNKDISSRTLSHKNVEIYARKPL